MAYFQYPFPIAGSLAAAAFPLLAPNGSAAAPSYSFSNSPGLGLFRQGSNILGIASTGSTANSQSIALIDPSSSTQFFSINREVNTSSVRISGGGSGLNGGFIECYGGSHPSLASQVSIGNGGTNKGLTVDVNLKTTMIATANTRLDVASAATITALSSANSFVKLTGVTATSLQGIDASVPVNGQRLTVVNLTGANLTVQHENAGATAANRITTMTGADVATTANGAADFIYDTGSSRWICLYVTA